MQLRLSPHTFVIFLPKLPLCWDYSCAHHTWLKLYFSSVYYSFAFQSSLRGKGQKGSHSSKEVPLTGLYHWPVHSCHLLGRPFRSGPLLPGEVACMVEISREWIKPKAPTTVSSFLSSWESFLQDLEIWVQK